MGWWKINNVEKGQIDFESVSKSTKGANAMPGSHSPDELYNGDGPADEMGSTLDRIAHMYKEAWSRFPQRDELLACLNFCANPQIGDDQRYVPFRNPDGSRFTE